MTRFGFHMVGLLAILSLVFGCNLPAAAPPEITFPLEWPLPPLTTQQVAAVRACDLETLTSERYPETVKTEDLESTFTPVSDCDWAALALAYAKRLEENKALSESGLHAFRQTIRHNHGFALADPIFYRFFDTIVIVNPPPLTRQEITEVQIQYAWGGLGDPVDYQIEIHQADTQPVVTVTSTSITPAATQPTLDQELIQALAPALDNLLPINSEFSLTPCYDNYPGWDVRLAFQDGAVLNLKSDSNFIPIGGPWQTEIDGQHYVQFSLGFVKALDTIIQQLELPYGQPMAWSCFGDEVFEQAFP